MVGNIVIVGSSGALGGAITRHVAEHHPKASIHAFSRHGISVMAPNVTAHRIDYRDEMSIAHAASMASQSGALDRVFVTTGLLHDGDVMPEKSLRDLSGDQFERLFQANTILPALVAKHFVPRLDREKSSIFAALSARVGSISDNRLGGWYAYRASKAALNMILKNTAIETARRNKQAIIVGLHPGTVDSHLSRPFQSNVSEGKLFSPDYSAAKMLCVLDDLKPADSGKCFGWDGKEIEP